MLDAKNLKKLISVFNEFEFLQAHTEQIVGLYSEPHRRYHTLEHVKFMLDRRDRGVQSYTDTVIPMSMGDQNLVRAIVLHDIIYSIKPRPLGVNEFYSAYWALEHGADKEVVDAITATGFYLCDQKNLTVVAMELCDLDLANLALPYAEYTYWAGLALEEAGIIYFPNSPPLNEALLRGQASFCDAMLERQRIYYRHPEWEDTARWNLEQKLAELESILNEKPG